ncbi:hypothetical protein H6F77_06080 [Microcoleus sp. FACHB-831]|uniref:hypothetical protein n=1 Tax=Microcoleus sp. FACHB-831 TaxID=2692827 RepID=UPI001688D5D4|nr:hypothetical protein [Microcoleus sp. FACHB-831]MBD1920656.1 hypothetical protein [Microcoleus sp. FACHB-831]
MNFSLVRSQKMDLSCMAGTGKRPIPPDLSHHKAAGKVENYPLSENLAFRQD